MANHGALRKVEGLVRDAQQLQSQIGKAEQDSKKIRRAGQNAYDAINVSLSENVTQAKTLGNAQTSGQAMWEDVEAILSRLVKQERDSLKIIRARDEQPHWLTTIANRELPPLPKPVPAAELQEQFREADEKVWQAHSLSSTLSSKVSQPAFWNQLAEQVVLFEEALERAEALFEEIEQIEQMPTLPISQLDGQLGASRQQPTTNQG